MRKSVSYRELYLNFTYTGYIPKGFYIRAKVYKSIVKVGSLYERTIEGIKMNLAVFESNKEIAINNFYIGGKEKIIISGPCSVEDYESMYKIVEGLKECGVHMLRGGAYKPRTSPYDFQGLEQEGLEILHKVGKEFGLPVSTEIMDVRDIDNALKYIDVIQIGARNMYNYSLLKEVGKVNVPVILKRGLSATLNEWLYAAEYIAVGGNKNIIFCERGIRTFETSTRNTLDLNTVAVIKEKYGLPVIVDPSHGTGRRDMVYKMSLAAIACGADGLIIESHFNPDIALSDSNQTIDINEVTRISNKVRELEKIL